MSMLYSVLVVVCVCARARVCVIVFCVVVFCVGFFVLFLGGVVVFWGCL